MNFTIVDNEIYLDNKLIKVCDSHVDAFRILTDPDRRKEIERIAATL